ncbi:MAG TPA: hypothetical protein VG028_04100 [Terriglobia bacterium]|nr:hypothetical protein [Terriglobia bacterium]
MANPQIVYTPAGGLQQIVNFVSPPQQQPGYLKTAIRHDNISTAGIRESVLERTDQFLELTLNWIRAGADLANWTAFLDYALTGAAFAYYPDASLNAYTNYVLEDTGARIAYKAAGIYALKLKCRVLVS